MLFICSINLFAEEADSTNNLFREASHYYFIKLPHLEGVSEEVPPNQWVQKDNPQNTANYASIAMLLSSCGSEINLNGLYQRIKEDSPHNVYNRASVFRGLEGISKSFQSHVTNFPTFIGVDFTEEFSKDVDPETGLKIDDYIKTHLRYLMFGEIFKFEKSYRRYITLTYENPDIDIKYKTVFLLEMPFDKSNDNVDYKLYKGDGNSPNGGNSLSCLNESCNPRCRAFGLILRS